MRVLRKCNECGLEAKDKNSLDLFVLHKSGKHNRSKLCKNCKSKRMKKYKQSKEWKDRVKKWRTTEACKISQRKTDLKRKYGITLEDYDNMLHSQNGWYLMVLEKVEHIN